MFLLNDVFADVFPNSRLRVTLRLISIKGGGSAVTAIITQFYFYFAHLKST